MTVNELRKLYDNDCKDIATQCVEDGYPAYGSNYELRCASLWDEYYRPQLQDCEDYED